MNGWIAVLTSAGSGLQASELNTILLAIGIVGGGIVSFVLAFMVWQLTSITTDLRDAFIRFLDQEAAHFRESGHEGRARAVEHITNGGSS